MYGQMIVYYIHCIAICGHLWPSIIHYVWPLVAFLNYYAHCCPISWLLTKVKTRRTSADVQQYMPKHHQPAPSDLGQAIQGLTTWLHTMAGQEQPNITFASQKPTGFANCQGVPAKDIALPTPAITNGVPANDSPASAATSMGQPATPVGQSNGCQDATPAALVDQVPPPLPEAEDTNVPNLFFSKTLLP